MRLSDAVMVARGDLGVEIPHEDVPGRQKELIRACRLAVKPVIVATQMLDIMVALPPRPVLKRRMWQPRFMMAPTQSCFRHSLLLAAIPVRRSR